MTEITPITPFSPVHTIYKVEREEREKHPPQKRPQTKPDPNKNDKQPAEHVDEIV
ncbi:hypothetical protein [Methylomonas rosea]|uniref:Uncharacterized protein n=1 Tax=Methylomonas rosea TaxID=2952227 RepID=A0ABT1TUU5_9GAMM|nr:hypothetical protein [Methylomonas sp. WSC-7]MCQ8118550.1 hypothetical protein [Methylomonas sp. WSC-7]